MASRAQSKVTTDHQEIRRWAEARGARPAAVRRTGGGRDPGIIRLDFPGYSGGESLEEISWDEFFEKFDDNNLAFLYQESTSGGQKSNFNKLISRDGAEATQPGRRRTGTSTKQRAARATASTRTRAAGRSRTSTAGTKARRTEATRGTRTRSTSRVMGRKRAASAKAKSASRRRRAA